MDNTTRIRAVADVRDRSSMDMLLNPSAVAVIGASERPGAPASVAFQNLLAAGFEHRLFPIHPTATSVYGIKAYPRISDIPLEIDCAVIGVGADKVIGALKDTAEVGARGAVVLASGFAELGEAGRERQIQLAAAANNARLSVCGPNCLGLVNVNAGVPLYSAAVWKELPKGGLAVISHSGSGAVSLSTSGRVGLSYVISAGNSAVCDMADYLLHLAQDEATRAAALFMETISDPLAFEHAMAVMHKAGKPVVVLRVGRSKAGAAASAAHTGSLVSSDEAFGAFFERNGVIAVDDMDELIETASLMTSLKSHPTTSGVGLINVSGGEVAHACDVAETIGLTFPKLSEGTLDTLTATLPSFGTPSNPLDATGAVFADPTLYPRCIEAMASDAAVGLLAIVQDAPVGLGNDGADNYRKIAENVADYARSGKKPVVFISNLSGGVHPHVREPLEDAQVPILNGTRAALKAVLKLTSRQEMKTRKPHEPVPPQEKWLRRLRLGHPFSEHETKIFLRDHGIPTTRESLAQNVDESVTIAAQLGFPVALKIASAALPHKTEIGGVALNLCNEEEVREAYSRIMTSVARHVPDVRPDGVLVQEMVKGGIESIIGLTRHHPFGLAVVVGSGGVLVELIKDAALALPPVSRTQARELIKSTRLATLLKGFRGAPAADETALFDLVTAISEIAVTYGEWVEALDLNPVTVLPAGNGVCVLDALLVPASKGDDE